MYDSVTFSGHPALTELHGIAVDAKQHMVKEYEKCKKIVDEYDQARETFDKLSCWMRVWMTITGKTPVISDLFARNAMYSLESNLENIQCLFDAIDRNPSTIQLNRERFSYLISQRNKFLQKDIL